MNLNFLGSAFSRINYTIPLELFRNKYEFILIHGYENITSWITLFVAKLLGIKTIWRGEAIVKNSDLNNAFNAKVKKNNTKDFFFTM